MERTDHPDQLVPIGQFAKLTWISAKTLRRYADIGLLPPARIDPDTGYRYYRLSQAERARLIRLLRMTDMPLAAIRAFLDAPSVDGLKEHERTLVRQQAARERVLCYLYALVTPTEETMEIEAAKFRPSQTSFTVRLKEVPALSYVSRGATVALGELNGFISASIRLLVAEHEAAGPPFTLFHGPLNADTDGPVEVCLPVAPGGPGPARELPAGAVAYAMVEGQETKAPVIMEAFDAVAVWAKRQGHELDGAPREIYHTDVDGPESQRWEIAWPVR